MIAAAGRDHAARSASAMRDHVLACQPWKSVVPVTDGIQHLWHISCHHGRSTHVGEVVDWQPAPAAVTTETILCEWCQDPLVVSRKGRSGVRKYHEPCAIEARRRLNREQMAAEYAAKKAEKAMASA